MAKDRRISMVSYGVTAVVAAATLMVTGFSSLLVVALTVVAAAAADRFINGDAEPDERMRSCVVYAAGAIGALLVILMFGGRLGSWTSAMPLVGFGLAALFDYVVPPAGYQPRDPHRYGASPPVTIR